MTIEFEFLFDFGSPNAYFVHKVIKGIEERTGVSATYVPTLLGGIYKATNNQSPSMAYAHIKNKLAYEGLEMQRFMDRHGLHNYQRNSHFPVNTLTIMRGAIAAQKHGVFEQYVDAVFSAMWEKSLKMDDPQVIMTLLQEEGLATSGIMESVADQEVKDTLLNNTNRAVERGAFGLPTFYVNGEMFFGKDRLGEVEECINNLKQADLAAEG